MSDYFEYWGKFFYRFVIGREVVQLGEVIPTRKSKRFCVVISFEEAKAV